jgi:hypothetical protein
MVPIKSVQAQWYVVSIPCSSCIASNCDGFVCSQTFAELIANVVQYALSKAPLIMLTDFKPVTLDFTQKDTAIVLALDDPHSPQHCVGQSSIAPLMTLLRPIVLSVVGVAPLIDAVLPPLASVMALTFNSDIF